MVKRQREKQYNSAREHRQYSQLRSGSAAAGSSAGVVQRRLPFSHCALTLTPFESPVCTKAGIVFENSAILPFVMKHKIDPVSGKSMTTSRDLITLHMDKDEEGRWQCPVMTKPFADHTKIVAIVQPGGNHANVYSYEAYNELNVKAKNYEDLVSGAKFSLKDDVIILNDPDDDEFNRRRDINTFYHVVHSRDLQSKDNAGEKIRHSKTATRIMEQLEKQKNKDKQKANDAAKTLMMRSTTTTTNNEASSKSNNNSFVTTRDGKRLKVLASDVTGVKYTTAKASSSLTSTSVDVSYDNEAREATQEEILKAQFQVMRKLKKKAYVRLHTTLGVLTIELHCDMVPRTCTNFLGLCQDGQYNDTRFHRLIANFMIQGGKQQKSSSKSTDAAATTDDESYWGGAFVDEFDDRLQHTGPGIVSMANAGPNTNRRQFFITFKSCNHLDRKHSVFGKVIDGLDVLKKMERIPTDKKDRPTQEIKIITTEILENPAEEARLLEQQRLEEVVSARQQGSKAAKEKAAALKAKTASHSLDSKAKKSNVGRYLKGKLNAVNDDDDVIGDKKDEGLDLPTATRLPPPPKKTTFGDFSGW